MTEVWRAAALGLLQGLTEFLPVSSSGHLVLVPALLGWPLPVLAFDALIHVATALAAALYLRSDWARMLRGGLEVLRRRSLAADRNGRLLALVLLAEVPAAVAGVVLHDWFAALFQSPRSAGFAMFVTAGLLVVAEYGRRNRSDGREPDGRAAVGVGLAQAIAIVPGISRSGATIAGGQLSGLSREAATRFSFLVAVPIILGAGVYEMVGLVTSGAPLEASVAPFLAGAVTAFAAGYAAVGFMLRFVARHTLMPFAVYTVLVGLLALAVL